MYIIEKRENRQMKDLDKRKQYLLIDLECKKDYYRCFPSQKILFDIKNIKKEIRYIQGMIDRN
jgi:hypothetical protein